MPTLNVLLDKNTGCLLWQGAKDTDGYGVVHVGKKTLRAHRWAWECVYGPLKPTEMLLHQCDTPACVNVAHLKPGTQRDNLKDRDAKGRQAVGEANGASKLTDEQRRICVESFSPSWKLAKDFGVDRATIQAVRAAHHLKRWAVESET